MTVDEIAIELDEWIRFAGCEHLGYISTAIGEDNTLLVYWDKVRMGPTLPSTFHGKPVEIKRIGKPIPA